MSGSRMAFFHRLLVSWGFISFSSSCITRSRRFSNRNGRKRSDARNTNINLFHRVLSCYTRAFDQRSRPKYSGKQLKHSTSIRYKVFFNFWKIFQWKNCSFFSHRGSLSLYFIFIQCLYIYSVIVSQLFLC